MIIDFHTHAFPEVIAKKAMDKLIPNCPTRAYTDGTVKGLKDRLRKSYVDMGVVLNITTKPGGEKTVNDTAADYLQDKQLVFFGSVNPHSDNPIEEIKRIAKMGIKGVKFHPDYQNFFIDDEKVYPIYEAAANLGLIISFHTGYDSYSPNLMHAPPQGLLNVIDSFTGAKMVFAHLGGTHCWDDVERYVAGAPVYLDTAICATYADPAQTARIIKKHGSHRVLFGSDCPWENPKDSVEYIKKLDINESSKMDILYKNAVELLGFMQGE